MRRADSALMALNHNAETATRSIQAGEKRAEPSWLCRRNPSPGSRHACPIAALFGMWHRRRQGRASKANGED